MMFKAVSFFPSSPPFYRRSFVLSFFSFLMAALHEFFLLNPPWLPSLSWKSLFLFKGEDPLVISFFSNFSFFFGFFFMAPLILKSSPFPSKITGNFVLILAEFQFNFEF